MMEEKEDPILKQDLYPPPPPYFHLAQEGSLQPPPPLTQGTYPFFTEIFSVEDGLPNLHVRRLYETNQDGSIDIKHQLRRLHRELSVNFIELLEVLINRPSMYARQVENIGLVLRNMMFLANQLRPVQARATIVTALEQELDKTSKTLQELREVKTIAHESIQHAKDVLLLKPE